MYHFSYLTTALILIFLPAMAQSQDTKFKCFSKEHFTRITEVVEQVMSDTTYNIPGVSLSIKTKCGDEINYSTGTGLLNQSQRITGHTSFRVGSVTKAFTGYLTMALVQAGLLTPESTLAAIMPELRVKLPLIDTEHITIRQLLNHTSGIPTYVSLNQGIYPAALKNPATIWSQDMILNAISGLQPLSKPGDKFHYSNSNYYLLGLVAEKVTHMSYEKALNQYIIEPLHLKHTSVPMPGNPQMPPKSAHGYMEKSPTDAALRDISIVDPSYPWAAGSVISTTDDLASFAIALHDRSLLFGASRSELYFPIPEAPGYSYGAGIIKNEHAQTIGHEGNIFGYECSTRYLLNENLALAVCINRSLFDQTLPANSSIDSVLIDKITSILNSAPAGSPLSNISDEKIEAFRKAGDINGMQLAFISRGQRIIKKYGRNRVDQEWSHQDLLRIASVSKSFLAALFFKLSESGVIKASDTVNNFIAADLLPNIELKKVTVGDLLRHSSGIPDYFTKDFIQAILAEPGRFKTEADALKAVRSLPVEFEPGKSIKYSNTNYVLLGLILDSIARDKGYAGHQDLLRKFILDPVCLESTFYENKEAKLYDPKNIVSGFLDGKDYLAIEQGYGLANGGLLSTVGDVATFFSAIFDPLSPVYLASKMMPAKNTDFGFGLYRLPIAKNFVGHTGEFAGYLSFAAYNPKTQTIIIGFADDSSEKAKTQFGNLQKYLFKLFSN